MAIFMNLSTQYINVDDTFRLTHCTRAHGVVWGFQNYSADLASLCSRVKLSSAEAARAAGHVAKPVHLRYASNSPKSHNQSTCILSKRFGQVGLFSIHGLLFIVFIFIGLLPVQRCWIHAS